MDGPSASAEQLKVGSQVGAGGSACSEPPCRAPASLPTPGRWEQHTVMDRMWVLLDPGPSRGWAQSKSSTCLPGQSNVESRGSRPGVTLRGREGKLREVPWPQVTASKQGLMTSVHSQLVGGRGGGVVKALKGNEDGKHLAKMSPQVRQGRLWGRTGRGRTEARTGGWPTAGARLRMFQ